MTLAHSEAVMLKSVVICLCLAFSYGIQHSEKVLKLDLSFQCAKRLLPGPGPDPASCTGQTADRERVISGGHCVIHEPEAGIDVKYECTDGQWAATDSPQKLDRHKRWDWISGSVGDLASTLACPAVYQTAQPPTFPAGQCTPEALHLAGALAESSDVTTVTWDTPIAYNSDGDAVSVVQIWGATSGSLLRGSVWGREYAVVYQATDDQGLAATCAFSFLVTVATCPNLPWPDNGFYNCSLGNQTGSTCTYSCHDGYELAGPSTVTCQTSAWSTTPTCQKVSCGGPPVLANGNVECGDASAAYTLGATCTLSCNVGYRLRGSLYTRCGEDGAWVTAQTTTCVDDTPPSIFCRTPQLFYTDRGLTTTTVTPELPIATDNVDSSPAVVKVSGPASGATLEAGSYDVQYKAVDADGNESPMCTVELRVLGITCGHPLEAVTDTNMKFDCTGYDYGDACTLGCYANLPLEGTDLLTCERNETGTTPTTYWSWGLGPMPYCRSLPCPDLDEPRNGSLDYDMVQDKPIITMTCDPGFTVPSMVSNGLILCHSTGWSPAYQRKVPECVVPEQALIQYPTAILYYSGECSDPTLLATYTSTLQTSVDQASTQLQALCPDNTTCSLINPSVSCVEGSTSDRLNLTFDVQAEFDHSSMDPGGMFDVADSLQIDVINPGLQAMIDAGQFDLSPWSLQPDSLTSELGDTACGAGYIKEVVRHCVPCPVGYYLAGSQCRACPVGQYAAVAGSQSCTLCPTGYSTRFPASESLDSCTALCGPGTSSPDKFEPCAACPLGQYQDSAQQTTCSQCPTGKTTLTEGAADVVDCQYYDVLLSDTSGFQELAPVATLGNLTLMFWMKAATDSTPNVVIDVNNVLVVTLADVVKIQTPTSSFLETLDPAPSDTWHHLAVVWDTSSSTLTVYRNGQLAVNQFAVSPPTDPLVQDGHVMISSDGVSGLYLSGFSLQDGVLGNTEVANVVTSCHVTSFGDVINMGAFSDVNNEGVTLIAPSICDAIDECQTSPCGSHICHNHVGGYTCTCYNGWSDDTCDTPSDMCASNDCMNGATCISGSTNYTCECLSGYSGTLCEETPGDGGLSTWTTWSECSVTCGAGTRSRVRSCDSPAPDVHGNTCTGHLDETETCSTDTCPGCTPLVGDAVTGYMCTTDVTSGLQTCTTQCADGYVVPSDAGTWVYTCGGDTGYTWQPAPGGLATCVAPVVPKTIVMTSTVTYTSVIDFDDVNDVMSTVLANTAATECHASPNCVNHVSMSNDVLTLTSTVTLSDTSDPILDQYLSDGIVSSSLQGVIDATATLEATAAYINASLSSMFDITVTRTTYTVDPASITMCASVECEPGYVEAAGLCAPSNSNAIPSTSTTTTSTPSIPTSPTTISTPSTPTSTTTTSTSSTPTSTTSNPSIPTSTTTTSIPTSTTTSSTPTSTTTTLTPTSTTTISTPSTPTSTTTTSTSSTPTSTTSNPSIPTSTTTISIPTSLTTTATPNSTTTTSTPSLTTTTLTPTSTTKTSTPSSTTTTLTPTSTTTTSSPTSTTTTSSTPTSTTTTTSTPSSTTTTSTPTSTTTTSTPSLTTTTLTPTSTTKTSTPSSTTTTLTPTSTTTTSSPTSTTTTSSTPTSTTTTTSTPSSTTTTSTPSSTTTTSTPVSTTTTSTPVFTTKISTPVFTTKTSTPTTTTTTSTPTSTTTTSTPSSTTTTSTPTSTTTTSTPSSTTTTPTPSSTTTTSTPTSTTKTSTPTSSTTTKTKTTTTTTTNNPRTRMNVDPPDGESETGSLLVYVLVGMAILLTLAVVLCAVLVCCYNKHRDSRKKTPPSPSPTGSKVWHNDDNQFIHGYNIPAVAPRERDFNVPAIARHELDFNIPAVPRREQDFNVPAVGNGVNQGFINPGFKGNVKRNDMFQAKKGLPGLHDINTDVEYAAVPKGGQAMLHEAGAIAYPTKGMAADDRPMKAWNQRRDESDLYSAPTLIGKAFNYAKSPITTDINKRMELPAYKKYEDGTGKAISSKATSATRPEETTLTVADLELPAFEYIGLKDQYADNEFNIPAVNSPPPPYRP